MENCNVRENTGVKLFLVLGEGGGGGGVGGGWDRGWRDWEVRVGGGGRW